MLVFLPAQLLVVALGSASSHVVVHRCSDPDGTQVFTDRSCASLGKSDRLPPPASPSRASATGARQGTFSSCAGSPTRLVRLLTDALHAQDVNRLLGLIDWQGTSNSGARATTRRMQGIARRESLEVALEPEAESSAPRELLSETALLTAEEMVAALEPPRPPTSIRVEQRGAGGKLESVRFGLTRDFGCYWLRM